MNFYLRPFKQEESSHEFRISGGIDRHPGGLKLLYELNGPLTKITMPPVSCKPARMDRLWEETCFELFLNIRGTNNYWEFNLSPSGDWNVYRFNAYREGMHEERAFIHLPFRVERGPDLLKVNIEINVEKILSPDQPVDAALSAVLKSSSGRKTYWALAHHGMGPDFHRKDGFLIKL